MNDPLSLSEKGHKVILFLSILFLCLHFDVNGHDKIKSNGVISGLLKDAETDLPIFNATIFVNELDRGVVSHSDGEFTIRNVPSGTYTIRIQHIAYESIDLEATISGNEEIEIIIRMSRTTHNSTEDVMVISSYHRDNQTTTIERVITGRNLRQQLGRTIAETLNDEPGLSQRSMGPAPARPVLRGLGGDRLLILEDGGRTGDLSATASDHALAIEPMTAEHIELIRGPSALIHGSNTLGGVINVIRGQIPTDRPDHLHWSGSTEAESVNNGLSGGLRALGPIGNQFAYRVDASVRNNSDISTPVGSMENTGLTTLNASAGISLIKPWGMVGISGNFIDTKYGVPGGLGIADAHPNGVDIEMFRRYTELKAQIRLKGDFLRRLDANFTYSFYNHEELEKPTFDTDLRIVGSEFGVLTGNGRIHLHHNEIGFIDKGLFGIWGETRDYAAGAFSQTPETTEEAISLYTFQESNFGKWTVQGALRFDIRQVRPKQERSSILIGNIRKRTFSGLSSSVKASYFIRPQIEIGSTVMQTFRAPGIEELFSEGPHLANFSFEKGNPDLGAESGWGAELFFNAELPRAKLNLTIFRNQFNNFIFPRDSNRRATRRDDLTIFIFEEERVLMTGAEANIRYRFSPVWSAGASASFVRGDFIANENDFPIARFGESENAVPMIPPLSSRLHLQWNHPQRNLSIGTAARIAASQNRTDTFEEATDGYVVYDVFAQYNFSSGGYLHTFSLNFENIANTEYRNHLSRIKSILPEAGRNLKLLYRFYF
ncbi:MAG: TonB-dependent receptor [Balneolaceae bacterium]